MPPRTVIAWTREHGLLRDPASASQYSQISDAGDNDPSPRGQPSADPRGLLQLSPDWSTVVITQQSSMPRLVSSSRDVDATTSLRCSCSFASCVSPKGSSTSCVYWSIAVCTGESLCVLVNRCRHGTAAEYLTSSFQCMSNVMTQRHLRSAATSQLIVPTTRCSTLGNRAFPARAYSIVVFIRSYGRPME